MSVFVECIRNPTSIALQWGRTVCLCVCVECVSGKMDTHLGTLGVSLDGRFSSVRTMETNLGEWACILSPGWGTLFFSCSRWVHVPNQIAVQFVFVFDWVRMVFEGLWKIGENGICFSRPWKSVKTDWGLWKFVIFRALEKTYQLISQKLHFPRPNSRLNKTICHAKSERTLFLSVLTDRVRQPSAPVRVAPLY